MFASKLYHRSQQRPAGEQVRCKECPLSIKPAHTTRWMHKSQTCRPSKVQGACRAPGTHRHMHRCQPPHSRMPTPPCSRATPVAKIPAASLHAPRPRQPASVLARSGLHHLPSQQNKSAAPAAALRAQPRAPPTKEFLAGMLCQSLVRHCTCTHTPAAQGWAPLGTQPARRSCSPWAPPTRQAHSAAHEALHRRQRSSCGGPCALRRPAPHQAQTARPPRVPYPNAHGPSRAAGASGTSMASTP